MARRNKVHTVDPLDGPTVSAIAARLRATRKALGLTQAELCERADLARNTYNQWEKGVGRPDLSYAIRLRTAFRLTLDWIYLGDIAGIPNDLAAKIIAARQ